MDPLSTVTTPEDLFSVLVWDAHGLLFLFALAEGSISPLHHVSSPPPNTSNPPLELDTAKTFSLSLFHLYFGDSRDGPFSPSCCLPYVMFFLPPFLLFFFSGCERSGCLPRPLQAIFLLSCRRN